MQNISLRYLFSQIKKGLDKPPVENTLKTDGCGSFNIRGMDFSWVSFLDGMQRVLFFTHNVLLADRLARTTGESERIEQEIEVQGWKKPGFFIYKKTAQWVFLGFFGFLGFFVFFLYICQEERVFIVFSVSRILLGASRL
jgi:hypothetical protein